MNERIIKKIINGLAILSMVAGAFGMIFCFIFLWSANTVDLIGAGFPFVGAAILFGTGLITLGIFNKK
jgi:hypothetical protein